MGCQATYSLDDWSFISLEKLQKVVWNPTTGSKKAGLCIYQLPADFGWELLLVSSPALLVYPVYEAVGAV